MIYNNVKNGSIIFLREKVKGAILLIIGLYLFFVNTVIFLFNPVRVPCIPNPYGPDCIPLDPINYFELWLMNYGLHTILSVSGGLALIIYSIRHFLMKKELDDSKAISL